uniref:G-protein coupled receptors family 1 profile domain-containing protein n=1 Tax=Romanomermis culicivorax TaxID=13658 RepID=A0A915KCQ3_ROMCU
MSCHFLHLSVQNEVKSLNLICIIILKDESIYTMSYCEKTPIFTGEYENCSSSFPDQCPPEKIFFDDFYENFRTTHKRLCLFLCFIGIFMNAMTMLILTRPAMRSIPNCLLTMISAVFNSVLLLGCDFTLMVSYQIYLIRASQLIHYDCPADEFSFAWAIFTIIHVNLSVLSKAASMWLSVLLAVYRFLLLKSTENMGTPFHDLQKNIKLTICALLGSILLLASPIFVSNDIDSKPVPQSALGLCPNGTIFHELAVHPFTMAYDCFLFKYNFWTVGLVFKFLPSLLLANFLTKIVHFMYKNERKRANKFRRTSHHLEKYENGAAATTNNRNKITQRTTKLLILILSSTLICELPCAFSTIFAGFKSNFNVFVYRNLGDVFETLSLLNGLVTFPLYCFMSSGFRKTFSDTFYRAQRKNNDHQQRHRTLSSTKRCNMQMKNRHNSSFDARKAIIIEDNK